MNIGLTITQYLSPALILMTAAVVSVHWPRRGAILHLVMALAAAKFLGTTGSGLIWLASPLAILAGAYWFGAVGNKRLALAAVCGLPAVTMAVCGAWPAYRVSQRIDDGNRGTRVVEGPGARLRWAPSGPGWPSRGGNWHEARRACEYLFADGASVGEAPQNVWRLPTAEELVRSMSLHGQGAGGVWDASRGQATYRLTPDKESPLWDPYSLVIYWWTATEAGERRAYSFAYNGRAMAIAKTARRSYHGFRCVTEPN